MTATELTDQDRAAAREAWIASCAQQGDGKEWYLACAVYLAGKRAGQDVQREAICDGESLFRERVPSAAARQLAMVLAWAAECQLATLEQIANRKSTSLVDLMRHKKIAETLVRHCKELGVDAKRALNGPCPRLLDAIRSQQGGVDGCTR